MWARLLTGRSMASMTAIDRFMILLSCYELLSPRSNSEVVVATVVFRLSGSVFMQILICGVWREGRITARTK